MSTGTIYNNIDDLMTAIDTIYSNDTNETHADTINTAANDIIESLWARLKVPYYELTGYILNTLVITNSEYLKLDVAGDGQYLEEGMPIATIFTGSSITEYLQADTVIESILTDTELFNLGVGTYIKLSKSIITPPEHLTHGNIIIGNALCGTGVIGLHIKNEVYTYSLSTEFGIMFNNIPYGTEVLCLNYINLSSYPIFLLGFNYDDSETSRYLIVIFKTLGFYLRPNSFLVDTLPGRLSAKCLKEDVLKNKQNEAFDYEFHVRLLYIDGKWLVNDAYTNIS